MDFFIRFILLGYFLWYVKVSGEDVPEYMPVCLLPVMPQGSGNEAINLGWILRDVLFPTGYDNCTLSQGHSQALTNCNVRYSGEMNSTHLSLDTDENSFFNLCTNSTAGGAQFLYIPKITSALLAEMRTLGECLLKQPYISQFCKIEAAEGQAENAAVFNWVFGLFSATITLLCMCFLVLKCHEWKHRRDYDSIDQSRRNNNGSFFSRICGGNNETNHRNQSTASNSAVQAGVFARAYHQVDAAIRSCIRPNVPNANFDNDQSSDAKSHNVNTPLL